MQALTAHQILLVWETGRDQHPLDQGLTILLAGLPGSSWDELANLSIGQRDRLLLHLHAATFGPRLQSLARCPACSEPVEFDLDTPSLWLETAGDEGGLVPYQAVSGEDLFFRAPTSRDLAVVARLNDSASARRQLVTLCQVTSEGAKPAAELTEEDILSLAACMAEKDPQANIEIVLECPACGTRWTLLLDIPTFFWREISAEAQRLVLEVHTLARAYGWREVDILAMGAARRQLYLEMVA